MCAPSFNCSSIYILFRVALTESVLQLVVGYGKSLEQTPVVMQAVVVFATWSNIQASLDVCVRLSELACSVSQERTLLEFRPCLRVEQKQQLNSCGELSRHTECHVSLLEITQDTDEYEA